MKHFLLLLLLLPFVLFAQKQGQAVIDSLAKELPLAKEDTNKVMLLNKLCYLYHVVDPGEGIKHGLAGLALAEKLQWNIGKGAVLISLGENYTSKSEFTKAFEFFTKALKIAEDANNKDVIALALDNICQTYAMQGDYAQALEYCLRALKINEERGNKRNMAGNLNNMGNIYMAQSNYPKALEVLFRALKINEETGNKGWVSYNLGNIGYIYYYEKEYSKALEYYSKAVKIDEELGDKRAVSVDLLNIGGVYADLKNYKLAAEYFFRTLKICEEFGNKEGIAACLLNISVLYLHQNNNAKALEYGLKALDINKEIGGRRGMAEDYGNIGATLMNMAATSANPKSSLDKAAAYMDSSIAICKEVGDLNLLQNNSKNLSDIDSMRGNYKDALAAYKQYAFYKDSIFSKDNKTKITNLEHQRELDLKESHIKILEQENKLKDLHAEQEKLARKILIGGIAMILIIGFSVVMYFIRKQKTEKMITNEKINTLLKEQELKSVNAMLDVQHGERKRIATDLHDRLGSMLSTVKLYFNTVEEHIENLKEKNREQYHKATSLLDEACDEVRKIAHNLVSGDLVRFGLVAALHQLKETIERTGKLDMKVLAFGMARLEGNTEIALYRIVQELLNNILKHSKATIVTIQLNKVENNLNIVVEDNGVGFDVATAMARDGMGLKNLETRVKNLGGTIAIDSGKGRGTTTIIDIPV